MLLPRLLRQPNERRILTLSLDEKPGDPQWTALLEQPVPSVTVGSMIMGTNAQQGIILNVVVGIVGALLAGIILTPFVCGGSIMDGRSISGRSWCPWSAR
jgi:hypothetical protein